MVLRDPCIIYTLLTQSEGCPKNILKYSGFWNVTYTEMALGSQDILRSGRYYSINVFILILKEVVLQNKPNVDVVIQDEIISKITRSKAIIIIIL